MKRAFLIVAALAVAAHCQTNPAFYDSTLSKKLGYIQQDYKLLLGGNTGISSACLADFSHALDLISYYDDITYAVDMGFRINTELETMGLYSMWIYIKKASYFSLDYAIGHLDLALNAPMDNRMVYLISDLKKLARECMEKLNAWEYPGRKYHFPDEVEAVLKK